MFGFGEKIFLVDENAYFFVYLSRASVVAGPPDCFSVELPLSAVFGESHLALAMSLSNRALLLAILSDFYFFAAARSSELS